MRKVLAITIFIGLSFGQQPFQSLEGVVGYIVIEKNGRIENYAITSNKDGSVKALKVDKSPSQLLKKTEEKEGVKNEKTFPSFDTVGGLGLFPDHKGDEV